RDVAGILRVTEHRPGEAVCTLLVARHEEIEGRLVPLGHALTERFVRWLHSPVVPSPFTLSLPTARRQVSLTTDRSVHRVPARADPPEARAGRHAAPRSLPEARARRTEALRHP